MIFEKFTESNSFIRNVATHLIVFGVGVFLVAPFLDRSDANSTNEQSSNLETAEVITDETEIGFSGETVNLEDSDRLGDTQIDDLDELLSDKEVEVTEEVAEITSEVASDTPTSDPLPILSDLLSTIDIGVLGTEEVLTQQALFNELIGELGNPATALTEYMASGIDEESMHVVMYMIAMNSDETLKNSIANELPLATEATYGAWKDVMSVANINTRHSREQLFAVLPSITDPELTAISLNSMKPSITSYEERAQFVGDIATFAQHTDPKVRSAAIETIGLWSVQEHAQLIARELNEGTNDTKLSATLASQRIRNDDIKDSLLGILANEEESFQLKVGAFNSIIGFNLEPHEQDSVHRFYTSHIEPLETQQN